MVDPFCGLAAGIIACLHENIDNFLFVEDSVSYCKGRFESHTFLCTDRLVWVMRVASKSTNVGMMSSSSNPKYDLLSSVIKDRLNYLMRLLVFVHER